MPRTHAPTRPKKDELIESITRLREEVFQATWSGWCDQWMHLDLTLAQLKALFRLYAVPPARMSELASALGVSLPSCTSLVDRLVQQGMVERRQDADDRRLVLCELSAQGTISSAGFGTPGSSRQGTFWNALPRTSFGSWPRP